VKVARAGSGAGRSGASRSGVARPCALRAPAVGIIVVAGLLTILARTTGSGWLVVMASALVPLFLIGAIAPVVPLTRAEPALRLPPDATVGRAVPVIVTVGRRARSLQLQLRDPATGWVRADGPASGTVLAVPSRRGVLDTVVVELRSAAPLGLVVWQRRITVRCGRPLEVGPVPIAGHAPLTRDEPRGDPSDGASARRGGDTVRGIRPYASGDPSRLVHWPATARWGEVLVRELDDDVPPRLVLIVDLRTQPDDGGDESRGEHGADAAEDVASRAAGLAGDALAAGRRVVLATAEHAGPVTAPVETTADAGRRLARAVAGVPGGPETQPGDVVVRLGVERGPDGHGDEPGAG
jgi:uncharacterized protein (DUF58 family)